MLPPVLQEHSAASAERLGQVVAQGLALLAKGAEDQDAALPQAAQQIDSVVRNLQEREDRSRRAFQAMGL